jgi:RNA polymerase sigma factor (sigma-70 family)
VAQTSYARTIRPGRKALAAVPSIGRASGVTRPVAAPEADATRSLYESYQRQIYNYCLHQLSSREEAEDAVQTTFMNAFRGLQRGIVPEAEQAWLFKIAENVCLSRRRSSWRRGRVEAPNDFEVLQEIVPSRRSRADELIGLEDALEAMPESQRRAILLREWQGLSYREIADELDISQAAVETLIFRARRTLAQGLEQPEPKKRRTLRRGASGINFGTLVAGVKSLLTGGAAVKAVAVAVVAGTATVAATQTTKPLGHAKKPAAAHATAPHTAVLAPLVKAPVTDSLSIFERAHGPSAAPTRKTHSSSPLHARRAGGSVTAPQATATPPAPPAATDNATPAPPATPAAGQDAPAAPQASQPKHDEPAPAPKHEDPPANGNANGNGNADHGRGNDKDKDKDKGKKDDPQPTQPTQPLPPAAEQPHGNGNGNDNNGNDAKGKDKKSDPAPAPAAAEPADHGNGNGNGNDKKDDAAPAPAAPAASPSAGNGNSNGTDGKDKGK